MEAEQETTSAAEYQLMAWEIKEWGFFNRVWGTIVQVLLDPKKTFTPPFSGNWVPAFYFALMMALFSLVLGGIWDSVFDRTQRSLLGLPVIVGHLLFLLPGLIAGAAITHLCLWVCKAAKRGFSTTFRVYCYCYAAAVFSLVPYVGEWGGALWGLVVAVIGFSTAHQVSWKRVALSYLVLVGLVILLIIIVVSFYLAFALIWQNG